MIKIIENFDRLEKSHLGGPLFQDESAGYYYRHWLRKILLRFQSNYNTNDSITFHYFSLHQNKALKKLWKMLFVSPKLLFWFLRYSNFMRKLGSWKQNNYGIIKWIAEMISLNFWENSKIFLNEEFKNGQVMDH